MSVLRHRRWRDLLPFGGPAPARDVVGIHVPSPSASPAESPAGRPAGWWDLLPFTTHRIQIAEDLWTVEQGVSTHDDTRTHLVLDRCGGSLQGKTIIDLGCNEGGFTIEFARRGAARAVGIEARRISYQRCELARKLLNLANAEFILGDIKEELPRWEGKADVVFLAGVLYHVADPYAVLQAARRTARDFVLIDTHVANPDASTHGCSDLVARSWGGHDYRGRMFPEYPPDISKSDHDQLLWAAWSDDSAFWPLEDDLLRMAEDVGFRAVEKIEPARYPGEWHVDQTNRILVLCRN